MTSFGAELTPAVFGQQLDALQNRMVYLTDFGGVGDSSGPGTGTVNDAALAAATAALNGGGVIWWPRGRYRFTSQPTRKDGVSWAGEGWTENPGIAGGVTYSGVFAYDGTILVFDENVPGPIAYDITDTGTASVVVADIAANGLASPYWKFKTARHTFTRDMLMYGGGGTNIDAHGFESRTQHQINNVGIINFAGSGLKIIASSDAGTVPYGNADGSSVDNVRLLANGMHGLHVEGRDANVMKFGKLHIANNGGLAVFENSELGNDYSDLDVTTNNRSFGASTPQRTQLLIDCPRLSDQYFGSIYGTSVVAAHRFHCYIENGTGSKGYLPLGYVTGQGADDSLWTSDTTAVVVDALGAIQRGAMKQINRLGSKTVGFSFGLPSSAVNDVFGWGSLEEDAGANYQFWKMGSYGVDGDHSWHLYAAGALLASALQLPGSLSTWNSRGGSTRWAPAFPNGFFLGGNGFGGGMPYWNKDTAAPTTGAWSVGDIVWNTAPVAGGTIGWVCVTAGSPGTWKTFGSIAA